MKKKWLVFAACLLAMMIVGCGKKEASQINASVSVSESNSHIPITGEIIGATAAPGNGTLMSDAEFETVLDNIAVVGDSVASGFGGYQKISLGKVFAVTGVGPSNIREQSFEYGGSEYAVLTILSQEQPKYIIISMGLNDINSYSPEEFSDVYMDFVEDTAEVCKNSQIYVFSVTPVAADCENISNQTIDNINAELKKGVLECDKNVRYVDCNSALKDDSGYMLSEYSGGDGIHFNSDAYDVMLEEFRYAVSGVLSPKRNKTPAMASKETEPTDPTEPPTEVGVAGTDAYPTEYQENYDDDYDEYYDSDYDDDYYSNDSSDYDDYYEDSGDNYYDDYDDSDDDDYYNNY